MLRIALFLVLFFSGFSANAAVEMHTSPYCWKEARIYTPSGNDDYNISIVRVESTLMEPKTLSPNKAYAFHLTGVIRDENTQSVHRELYVFVERPYLLKIIFPDTRDLIGVRWVNEKLLYVRVWRGRIAGSDFIIDVESETVSLQEPFIWGQIAFQQFQQCAKPEWADLEQCQCDHDAGRE